MISPPAVGFRANVVPASSTVAASPSIRFNAASSLAGLSIADSVAYRPRLQHAFLEAWFRAIMPA